MRIPVALIALTVLVASATYADDTMKRVAVVQFETPNEYQNTLLADGLTDMITAAITKLGNFDVIERAQSDRVLRERNVSAKGFVSTETAAKLRQLLTADLVFDGKLTEFGIRTHEWGIFSFVGDVVGSDLSTTSARVKIDCRLVDTASGKIIWADTGEATESHTGVSIAADDFSRWLTGIRLNSAEWDESRIGHAMRQAVDQITDKLHVQYPTCGRLLGILEGDGSQGSLVVIDLGTVHDFKPSDILVAYRVTAVTNGAGEVIWTDRQKIGLVRIVEPRLDRSRAIVEIADPPLCEGDILIQKSLADKIPIEQPKPPKRGRRR